MQNDGMYKTSADKPAFIDPPRGRLNGYAVAAMPKVRPIGGPDLARSLFTAQLDMRDIERLQPEPKKPKLNSAQRRAARIAAGQMRVVDGKYVGV
jgi:hypothetical protein